jgi:tetraspanin-11
MGLGTAMEGCGKFVKWTLCVINMLIFAGGFLVFGVGIWTVVDKSYIEVLLRNELYITMAYVLIVAGILVVFVSFVGCLGAVKEVRCMMLTYFITLFLMFVVLVIGGVLGYVFRDQVEDNIRPEMRHTIEVYDPSTPQDAVTAAWDDTQKHLHCCGMGIATMMDSPWKTWKMNHRINPKSTDEKVPASCCKSNLTDCSLENPVDVNAIYTADCFVVGLAFVQDHAVYLAGVALGISSLMVRS